MRYLYILINSKSLGLFKVDKEKSQLLKQKHSHSVSYSELGKLLTFIANFVETKLIHCIVDRSTKAGILLRSKRRSRHISIIPGQSIGSIARLDEGKLLILKKLHKATQNKISETIKADQRICTKLKLQDIDPVRAMFLDHYSGR